MLLHHTKHHQTYVNGLNTAEAAFLRATTPKERISLQPALKFNGGGHINHCLFWENLSPTDKDGGKLPNGPLKEALIADFGSVEEFKKRMNAATAAVQGSGWGWLVSYGLQPPIIRFDGTALGILQVHQEARDCHHPQPRPASL